MKRAWQLTSLGFCALALVALVESLRYPMLDRLGPGPGLFPCLLALATAGVGLALAVQVSLGRVPEAEDPEARLLPSREARRPVLAVLVALAGATLLLGVLGFRLTMFLFLVGLPWALGARNPWAIVLFALAGSVGLHWVLSTGLELPLPAGRLGL